MFLINWVLWEHIFARDISRYCIQIIWNIVCIYKYFRRIFYSSYLSTNLVSALTGLYMNDFPHGYIVVLFVLTDVNIVRYVWAGCRCRTDWWVVEENVNNEGKRGEENGIKFILEERWMQSPYSGNGWSHLQYFLISFVEINSILYLG